MENNEEERDLRFLLFNVIDYYPVGGMGDCIATYNTMEELYKDVRRMQASPSGMSFYEDDLSIYDRIEGFSIEYKNELPYERRN